MTALRIHGGIGEAWRRAWMPRENPGLAAWAAAHRRVPETSSARPGPWDNDVAPYLVGVMDAIDDPLVSRVTFMKSSQVGATEVLINAVMHAAACAPAPAMFLYPNETDAATACRDRVLPSIEATPVVARLLPAAGRSSLRLAFESMTVVFASSRSKSATKMRPIGLLFRDELDDIPEDARERAAKRTDTFPNHKIVDTSTPSLEGQGIDQGYQRSDRRRFWVPCPLCGAYQVLRWNGLRWEGKMAADLRRITETVGYECERCRARIAEHHKGAMLRAGRWAKHNQQVIEGGVVTGEPDDRVTPGQHAGFWINQIYSPFVPWARIAHEWVEHRGAPPADWVNHVLAEPYYERGHRVEVAQLRRHLIDLDKGGYRRGTLTRGALSVTASIDLQQDRMYVEWLAWGEKAAENWLVDYAEIPAPMSDPVATARAVDGVLDRAFTVPADHPLYSLLKGRIQTAVAVIDSGQGKRTAEVYRLCLARPSRLRAAKGVSSEQMRQNWDESTVELEGVGKRAAKLPLLRVNVDRYKEENVQMLGLDPPGWGGAADAGGDEARAVCPWRFPAAFVDRQTGELESHDDYLMQLSAEEYRPKKGSTGRAKKMAWELRPGRRDNHYLDCRVYHLALRDRLRLSRLTLNSVRAHLERGLAPGAVEGSTATSEPGDSRKSTIGPVGSSTPANPLGGAAGIGMQPRRFTRRR